MLSFKYLLFILLLGFVWSPTFLIVRISVEEASPVVITFLRCLSGAIFLSFFSKFKREHFKRLKKIFYSSFVGMVLPFLLCAYGEIYVDSSTAGIIESTTPIFALLFAVFLFRNSAKIQREQVYGIFAGFIGILIIFYPTFAYKGSKDFLGMASVLLMAVCFAYSFLYAQKNLKDIPPITLTCLHLASASIILLPFAPLFPWTFSGKVLLMTSFLGTFGTAFGWFLLYWLIRRIDASFVSLATMLCPIFCIYWGYLFLQEEITWNKITGTAIILLSVFLMEEKWSARIFRKSLEK